MTFDQWLAAKGFEPQTITATQRSSLEAAWRVETHQVADTETIRARWTDARWHYTDGPVSSSQRRLRAGVLWRHHRRAI